MKEQRKHLKKNLKLLQKTHPLLAYQLTTVDVSHLQFYWTQEEERNLQRLYEGNQYHYHSPISAQKEAQEWFQSLDLHLATVIFVYGIGLGYYYTAAKGWLKQYPQHRLVFFEEDLGVLYRLCETELGSQLLRDPQVQVVYYRDRVTDKSLFNEISWIYLNQPFVITSLKLYQELNPEGFLQLSHELSHDLAQKGRFIEEYLHFGITFFRNFYPNLLTLPQAYRGNQLFNHFSGVPAIICGAGPSLNKNIHLLKKLNGQALLFAGGSALNALIPKEIIPHFGAAIDPNKSQYPRVVVTQPYEIPFFYRNRLFHEALQAITGPRLYLTGAGGYAISRWFEEQLDIEGRDLEEGNNVVNFCLEIAQALGCNPIILVGVDLAFTNQQYYADGIVSQLNLTEDDFKTEDDFDSCRVLKEDIHGQPVYTLWKWLTEAEWISAFAEQHPETTIINATEGGIGFKGVPNLTLQAVIEQYLRRPQKKIESLNEEIQKHQLSHISSVQVIKLLKKLQSSLNTCLMGLSRLMGENEQLASQIKQGHTFSDQLQTPTFSLIENDLEDEIGYQYLLETFNQVYIRWRHRDFQELQSPKRRLSQKNRALKRLNLQKQRLVFLRDVAHVNCELIQRTLNQESMPISDTDSYTPRGQANRF